jgi:hypothetical protein
MTVYALPSKAHTKCLKSNLQVVAGAVTDRGRRIAERFYSFVLRLGNAHTIRHGSDQTGFGCSNTMTNTTIGVQTSAKRDYAQMR